MRHVRLVDGESTQFSTTETGQNRPFTALGVKTSIQSPAPLPSRRKAGGGAEQPRCEAEIAVKIMPASALRNQIRPVALHESSPGLNRKLGLEVALVIEDEFLRSGWPAGRIFGLQADIQRRFNIGRWALREAVRVLEMRGSADMRRGRGGGLMIARPTLENVLKPCALYLLSRQASYAHLEQAACILVEIASETISQCYRNEVDLALELSSALAESGNLLKALVTIAGNPALLLVASIIEAIAGSRPGSIEAFDPQHLATISKAILAGQGHGVPEFVSDDLPGPAEFDLFRWLKPSASLNACRYSTQLAFRMLVEIVGRAHTESSFLGSECEIAEHYQFSLESVRQMSRMLEDMGVIECRLGRHGGLFTRKPVLTEILPQTFAYLLHQGIARADALLIAEKMTRARSFTESDSAAENPILTLLGALLDAYACRIEPENSRLMITSITH